MIPHVLLEVTGQAKIEMRHPESFNSPGMPSCGVPIIRIIVVWGLYRGPPIEGNSQIELSKEPAVKQKLTVRNDVTSRPTQEDGLRRPRAQFHSHQQMSYYSLNSLMGVI